MPASGKVVLLLGAGLMAKPALNALDAKGISTIVACRSLQSATDLCYSAKHAQPLSCDVNDRFALDAAVSRADVVISLVPYIYNVAVVESAIRKRKNVVTTSYISPGLVALTSQIEAAGITVLNESGLDPGIDHLYAIKVIAEVHRAGGQITSFESNCGGLPAPEHSDNPFGLKFSWSPRGVLLASQSLARRLVNGNVESIEGGAPLMDTAEPYFIYPGYSFVSFPNRDSAGFRERYAIPEAKTVMRGNLRYPGCVELFKALGAMGYFNPQPLSLLDTESPAPPSWKQLTAELTRSDPKIVESELISHCLTKVPIKSAKERAHITHGLKWLGIFSATELVKPRSTPLDTLCALLEDKLAFGPGERDMVMLQHKFGILHADGRKETRTSTLLQYGDPEGQPGGFSAMATLVGTAAAVATSLVLDGTISKKGLIAPLTEDITIPFMKRLKDEYQIECIEKTLWIEE